MKGRLKVILGGREKSSGTSWWPLSSNLVSSTLSMASWEAWVLQQQQQQQKKNERWDQKGGASAENAQYPLRKVNQDEPLTLTSLSVLPRDILEKSADSEKIDVIPELLRRLSKL